MLKSELDAKLDSAYKRYDAIDERLLQKYLSEVYAEWQSIRLRGSATLGPLEEYFRSIGESDVRFLGWNLESSQRDSELWKRFDGVDPSLSREFKERLDSLESTWRKKRTEAGASLEKERESLRNEYKLQLEKRKFRNEQIKSWRESLS